MSTVQDLKDGLDALKQVAKALVIWRPDKENESTGTSTLEKCRKYLNLSLLHLRSHKDDHGGKSSVDLDAAQKLIDLKDTEESDRKTWLQEALQVSLKVFQPFDPEIWEKVEKALEQAIKVVEEAQAPLRCKVIYCTDRSYKTFLHCGNPDSGVRVEGIDLSAMKIHNCISHAPFYPEKKRMDAYTLKGTLPFGFTIEPGPLPSGWEEKYIDGSYYYVLTEKTYDVDSDGNVDHKVTVGSRQRRHPAPEHLCSAIVIDVKPDGFAGQNGVSAGSRVLQIGPHLAKQHSDDFCAQLREYNDVAVRTGRSSVVLTLVRGGQLPEGYYKLTSELWNKTFYVHVRLALVSSDDGSKKEHKNVMVLVTREDCNKDKVPVEEPQTRDGKRIDFKKWRGISGISLLSGEMIKFMCEDILQSSSYPENTEDLLNLLTPKACRRLASTHVSEASPMIPWLALFALLFLLFWLLARRFRKTGKKRRHSSIDLEAALQPGDRLQVD